MTLDEVKQYFGSTYNFNKKTGMHHGCIKNWNNQGYIPIKTQLRLEKLTNGELKASLEHINKED